MKNLFILLTLSLLMIGTLTAGTISGTVSGPNGLYLENTLIRAFQSNNDMPFVCYTDADGIYQFTDIENGSYFILAGGNNNESVPQYYDGVYHILDATPIVVSDSTQVVDSINFVLEYYSFGNSISGTITNEENEPIANAQAIITRQVGHSNWTYSDWTNDNGEYTIDMIQGGIYSFKAIAYGYEDYCATDTTVVLEFTDDTVIENYDVVLTTLPIYEVSGMVRDNETGLPIEYASVVVSSNNGCNFFATAETDNNGEYTFLLMEGNYQFRAQLSNLYDIQYYDHQYSALDATIVNVISDITGIDFDLNYFEQFQNSISGIILDNGEAPEYPVMAVAVSSDQDWVTTAEMYSDGSYMLSNLPTNEYYILAVPQSAPPTYYEDVIIFEDATSVMANGTITGIDINLNSAQGNGFININGYVTDNNGDPVTNTSVIFNNSEGVVESYATTNDNGYYEVSNLIWDDYEIIATKIFYESDFENMMVFEDGNADFIINSVLTNADNNDIPVTIGTLSNYPNPFNPTTTISYQVQKTGNVNIEVYNIIGQKITTLVDENQVKGEHNVVWNGKDNNGKSVSSGIYFYRLKNSRYTATNKMILMK